MAIQSNHTAPAGEVGAHTVLSVQRSLRLRRDGDRGNILRVLIVLTGLAGLVNLRAAAAQSLHPVILHPGYALPSLRISRIHAGELWTATQSTMSRKDVE